MENNIAIYVNQVSKKFKIYEDKPVSLKERFLYRSKGVFQEKWILNDISISVEKGQMVGLVGRNGAGKSSLLKIMSKILQPDKGSVHINGRVSSLLELGAGFHMDFTGRENIYMNASIFGLNRKEINERLDDIITFSELLKYIDNPVRTYSSGMYMRLAFSIAIHVNPDILLIDEILAVGDNAFQKKCINRIEQLKREGKTIVFVSHDNGVMEQLCDKLYWVQDSRIVKHGEPKEIISDYMNYLSDSEAQRMQAEAKLDEIGDNQKDGEEVSSYESVSINNVTLVDQEGKPKLVFNKGQAIDVVIDYKVNDKELVNIVFGIGIHRNDGVLCYGTNTDIDKFEVNIEQENKLRLSIEQLNLIGGDYYLNIFCHDIEGMSYTKYSNKIEFTVYSFTKEQGIAYLPHQWNKQEG